jgi:alcohol dehydrogenase
MTNRATAAVFTGPGRPLELRTFPLLPPKGGEVLVRVTGCTLCGSDLHTYEGRRAAPTPSVLGHEIVGVVEALGPAAPRHDLAGAELRPGDRITWSVCASCGRCFYCDRELPQKCEQLFKYGHEQLRDGAELSGGLADHCLLVPGSAILRLPDELNDEVACPASCATATVAAALRSAGPVAGRTVLVQGAGLLGLTACAMARAGGAAEVICCDVDGARLRLAEGFGASRLALPGELGAVVADVALEMSGAPAAFEVGLPLLRTGGIYVLVGAVFPSRPVSLALEEIVRRLITLRGVHNYAPEDLRRAVDFLAGASRYPFAELVARWFPLAAVEEAFRAARAPGALRVGVRP